MLFLNTGLQVEMFGESGLCDSKHQGYQCLVHGDNVSSEKAHMVGVDTIYLPFLDSVSSLAVSLSVSGSF